jgi:RND family efflux transporter MFP subunit
MRRRQRRLVTTVTPVALLLATTVLTLPACSNEPPEVVERLRPVRAVQVYSTGGQRSRTFSGVAVAGVETNISFKVGGTIQQLAVNVGTVVRKGQLLAELDPTDYQLQLQDAEAAQSRAAAELRNATSDYDRVRGLYEARNASKQDLDAARAGFESATAGVESAKNQVELARRQLGYTRLVAPIDGSIASRPVDINENVQAGQTVCRLDSDANLDVEVAMPGVLIPLVREGGRVQVTFDAISNTQFIALITEVGVAAGGSTTFPVKVRLMEMDARLRSGMSAEVEFDFHSTEVSERYIVPGFAVGEDRDGRFVFIVATTGENGVGVVTRRPVTIDLMNNAGIEVTSGLNDGEYVVTAGVSKLTDGQRVRFNPPASTQASEGP